MPKLKGSLLSRYLISVLLVSLAIALRLFLRPVLEDSAPFLLFGLAIIIAAWYGGFGPAIVATILSTIAVIYLFISPNIELPLFDLKHWFWITLFGIQGLVVAYLVESLHKARRAAEQSSIEAKESEKRLGESERDFRQLADAMPQIVWTAQPDGWVDYNNQRWFEYSGISPEDTEGWGWKQMLHPDDIQRIINIWSESLITGEPYEIECRLKRASDGIYRWHLARAVPIRDSDGRIIKWYGTSTDIDDYKRTETALRESEARSRIAQRAARVGTWSWNVVTNEVFWSEGIWDLLGIEQGSQTPTPLSWFEFVHPEDKEEVTQHLNSLMEAEEEFFSKEYRIINHDGTVLWIETKGQITRDGNGRAEKFFGANINITERKRAEEALKKNQAQLYNIISSAMDAIITIDKDQRIVMFNSSAERLFEISSDEIIGKPIDHLIPERFRAFHRTQVENFGRANITTRRMGALGSLYGLRNSGKEFPIEASISQIEVDKEKFYTVILRDITERKQAEEERERLLEQEHKARVAAQQYATRISRLQEITSSLTEALTATEMAEVIVNQGAKALGAYAGAVVLLKDERTLEIISSGGQIEGIQEEWRQFSVYEPVPLADVTREGLPIWIENTEEWNRLYPHLQHRKNTLKSISGAVVPLSIKGRSVGAFSLSFDSAREFTDDDKDFVLTLARQCAQAIERAQLYELEHQARNQAEDAGRIKDEFLATLSHELRTPLTSILGWSRMLQTGQLSQEHTRQAIETITRNAKAQSGLIDDLLDISRLITGKFQFDIAPTDIRSVVNAAVNTVRLSADVKGISIRTEVAEHLETIIGDANRLQQVVWNLLSNAIKFTPEGGEVSVVVKQAGFYIEIEIIDTGQGIRADVLPFIFDRFKQADSSITRKHGGLGLGLAIVKHIVEHHGGSIQAESLGEGRGSTFRVRLPIKAKDLPENIVNRRLKDGAVTDNSLSSMSNGKSLSGKRLLVVEDEESTREFIKFALEQSGAEVIDVESALEAMEKIKEMRIDLIVSDLGMPVVNGYQLIEMIRELPEDKGGTVPAIALTAYARTEDKVNVLRAGYQMHLSKPVEPSELITTIVKLIKETGKAAQIK
jgi:PAS domain S-box-containing protein